MQQPEQQKSQLHFYKHDQSYDYLVITLSHYCGNIKLHLKQETRCRMRSITKKVLIYSLISIMHVGLGTTVMEAASLYPENPQQIRLDSSQNQRDEQQRQENIRHQIASQRHVNENDQSWKNRQRHENQQHNNTMSQIDGG